MSRDPVKELEDQIRLFRTELSEVKLRQITPDQLMKFQSSLDELTKQITQVQLAASQGALQGASQLLNKAHLAGQTIDHKMDKAVRSLSEAQRAASEASGP